MSTKTAVILAALIAAAPGVREACAADEPAIPEVKKGEAAPAPATTKPEAVPSAKAEASKSEVELDYERGQKSFDAGDMVTAMNWFKRGVEAGHPPSEVALGMVYVGSDDADKAAEYFRRAAEKNYADGQYMLGSSFATGDGLKQDYAKAREWLGKAADQGHEGAIIALAAALVNKGLGYADSDLATPDAHRLIDKAADLGDIKVITWKIAALTKGTHGYVADAQAASTLQRKLNMMLGIKEEKKRRRR